jgi:hypothetical protein
MRALLVKSYSLEEGYADYYLLLDTLGIDYDRRGVHAEWQRRKEVPSS